MGELFEKSFPHTPFKNARTVIIETELLVCEEIARNLVAAYRLPLGRLFFIF